MPVHKSRAYSVLNQKSYDDAGDHIVIKGIASTPTPDRYGDIVVPTGAKFQTPMPLLWQHNSQAPIGHVVFAEPNDEGIPFEAHIPKVAEDGNVKTRIDEAIHSLKYALVNAVSIGFQAEMEDVDWLDNGGLQFNVWEWLELSLVTIPGNAEALLSSIKSFDLGAKSASGSTTKVEPPARVRATRQAPTGPFYFSPDKENTQ